VALHKTQLASIDLVFHPLVCARPPHCVLALLNATKALLLLLAMTTTCVPLKLAMLMVLVSGLL
jgi:hypothetical protein